MSDQHDQVLILDFGSQVTQLIAPPGARERRLLRGRALLRLGGEDPRRQPARHHPFRRPGPSVIDEGSPRAPQLVFELGVPVLGICYGQQTLCLQLGGEVVSGGRARVRPRRDRAAPGLAAVRRAVPGGRARAGLDEPWRPRRPYSGRIRGAAVSEGAPFATFADERRRFYGVMFHPEVVHTPNGAQLLRNFTPNIAGCRGDWTMAAFRAEAIRRIRAQVGTGRVICGLSGGVDSSVAAVLLHEAIGDQLTCIFVDHGLLRGDEAVDVIETFRGHYNIPLSMPDASELFLAGSTA